jgi:hypothetical protein
MLHQSVNVGDLAFLLQFLPARLAEAWYTRGVLILHQAAVDVIQIVGHELAKHLSTRFCAEYWIEVIHRGWIPDWALWM